MSPERKRQLKKLGKQRHEEYSQKIKGLLAESNPAPTGSDQWAKNYKASVLKERALRIEKPNKIISKVLLKNFVLNPTDPSTYSVPTYYIQCLICKDALHSAAEITTECTCGQFSIIISENPNERRQIDSDGNIRWVRLIGRGDGTPKKDSLMKRLISKII